MRAERDSKAGQGKGEEGQRHWRRDNEGVHWPKTKAGHQ